MQQGNEPEQLDRDIDYSREPEISQKRPSGAGSRLPAMVSVGVVLIILAMMIQPGEGGYEDSPPPAEQIERDSAAVLAQRVEAFQDSAGRLPLHSEIPVPAGYNYSVEDDSMWSAETPGGLYYTSDMDMDAFARGDL